jgi:serine/threonine protein kinase
VLKCLQMDRLKEWKSMELFEREASVLKSIHHPFIPKYVDFFEHGRGKNMSFILVQEYIQGINLQEKADGGWHPDENEITEIAIRLLEILSYIHGLRPPVIHRDINPKNLIMAENGDIFLVDFGSVQDKVKSELERGSTFVGTPGYTPIEQFQGMASVRSDLYGFAATLVYLLTHRLPADLATEGLKPDVSRFVTSPRLRDVLENYLEPDERKRDMAAEDAIRLLEGKREPGHSSRLGSLSDAFLSVLEEVKAASRGPDMRVDPNPTEDPGPPPPGSKLSLTHEDDRLELIIPRGSGEKRGIETFAILWNAIVLVFTAAYVFGGVGARDFRSLIYFLPILPFWATGAGIGYAALFERFGKTKVLLNRNGPGKIEKRLIFVRRKIFETAHVSECELNVSYVSNNTPAYSCKLVTPQKGFFFGQKLSNAEKKWICNTVNYWINTNRRS